MTNRKQTLKLSVPISLLLVLFTSCHREEIDIPINADFSYKVIDNDYSDAESTLSTKQRCEPSAAKSA